jgi:hypothetical protein
LRFSVKLDGATLTGGVAALEKHDDALAAYLNPRLHLDQLDLEQFYFLEIGIVLHHLLVRIGAADDIFFALGALHLGDEVRRDAGPHLLVDQFDHGKSSGQRPGRALAFLHFLFQPLFLRLLFSPVHLNGGYSFRLMGISLLQ